MKYVRETDGLSVGSLELSDDSSRLEGVRRYFSREGTQVSELGNQRQIVARRLAAPWATFQG